MHAQAEIIGGGSAVSWASILAGTAVAAGVSLILLALGSGLGFASLSPWPGRGLSAGAATVAAAVWLIVTQWIASSLGGYIAGRLRTRWVGTHEHEVFFRDTAHGLVTWALSTVVFTAWVATALSSMIGGGVRSAADAATEAEVAVPAARTAVRLPPTAETYDIDRLFRATGAAPPATSQGQATPPGAVGADGRAGAGRGGGADPRAEAAHILANYMAAGALPDADRQYLAALVAERTGVAPSAADKRVDDFVADASRARTRIQAEADAGRKAASESSIYLSLALLIGAFIASVSAALGGRLRDQHP